MRRVPVKHTEFVVFNPSDASSRPICVHTAAMHKIFGKKLPWLCKIYYPSAIEQERIRQQAIANQYQQAAYNDMLALRSHQHSIGQVTWIPTITTGFDPMAPQRLHPLPIQMGVPHAVIPVTQFASLPQQQNPSNDALVWRPHYWG